MRPSANTTAGSANGASEMISTAGRSLGAPMWSTYSVGAMSRIATTIVASDAITERLTVGRNSGSLSALSQYSGVYRVGTTVSTQPSLMENRTVPIMGTMRNAAKASRSTENPS